MNTRIFKTALVALSACMFFTSCEDEMKPSFPDPIVIESVTNLQESITFTANMDWELSIPVSLYSYFWIDDSERGKVSKIKGGPGTYTVTIGITDESDFDNDTYCPVTLTMGGQKRVVAEYTLLKATRDFDVYSASIDVRGFFGFADDTDGGGFIFDQNASESLSIAYHVQYGFALPVIFDPGFHYDIEWPEWVEVSLISNVALGEWKECPLIISVKDETAIPSSEALSGEIVVKVRNSSEVVKTIPVTFAPVKDFVAWEGEAEILFDGKGKFSGGMSEGQSEYKANLYSTEGVVVFAAASYRKANMGGSFWVGSEVEFVTIADSGWDAQGGHLQRHELSFSMIQNPGDERTVDIYAIPASLAKKLSNNAQVFDPANHALNDNYNDVKAEIKPYKIATLIQDFGGDMMSLVSPETGVTFTEVEEKYYNPNLSPSGPSEGEDSEDGNPDIVSKYLGLAEYSITSSMYLASLTCPEFTVSVAKLPVHLHAKKFIPGLTSDLDKFENDDKLFNMTISGNQLTVKISSTAPVEGFVVIQDDQRIPIGAIWIEYTPAN